MINRTFIAFHKISDFFFLRDKEVVDSVNEVSVAARGMDEQTFVWCLRAVTRFVFVSDVS